MKIRLSPLAVDDIQSIKNYVEKDLMNPTAAINTVTRIIKTYSLLSEQPYMGTLLSMKIPIDIDYRFVITGNYIIFYLVDGEWVSIYRILYKYRDYLQILQ